MFSIRLPVIRLPKTHVFGSIRLLEIRLQAANGHKGLGYGLVAASGRAVVDVTDCIAIGLSIRSLHSACPGDR
jgi:hypothetical protein